RLTSFAIGWIRKTSSQLIAGVDVQLAPGPVIFQTLPRPVVPSLAQRIPFLSKAMSLAPGRREPKMAAMGGWLTLGLNVYMVPAVSAGPGSPPPSTTNRSPFLLDAIPM